MRNLHLIALVLTSLFLFGCAPAATPTPVKKGTIRVAFPTTPDTADVPSLMAHELLTAQGYTIEPTFFASPDVEVSAVAKGDVDISNGSTRTHWAAAQKGAAISTLMEQAADTWSLVTSPAIKDCPGLDGKKVGVNSAGSISNALLMAYVQLNCPNAHPEAVFVSGSDNRSLALQAGELDGALLEIADVLELDKTASGQYPTLINYATVIPKLKTNGVYATKKFAQEHPEMVRDYLRALLTVHRNINEKPQLLYDALIKYTKRDAATAKEIGNAYLQHGIWNVNGGLTPDDVKYSMDFFVQMGSLPGGMNAADVTDVSFLNEVLNEIGRK